VVEDELPEHGSSETRKGELEEQNALKKRTKG
jgi:hypothetical protein